MSNLNVASVDPKQLEKIAFLLKSIAHPLRLNIIQLLYENKELSVGEICKRLNSEQSLTSHHLTNMRTKGIIQSKRSGQHIFYSLKIQEVIQIIACVKDTDLS